jgi:hypothetical protein
MSALVDLADAIAAVEGGEPIDLFAVRARLVGQMDQVEALGAEVPELASLGDLFRPFVDVLDVLIADGPEVATEALAVAINVFGEGDES